MATTPVVNFGIAVIGTQLPRAVYMDKNWSRNEQKHLRNNVISSVGPAFAFSALKSMGGPALMGYGAPCVLLAPVIIGGVRHTFSKLEMDPNSRLYYGVDFAHRKWERFNLLVNIVALIGLVYLGAPLTGWVGLTLLIQILAANSTIEVDEKKLRMLKATAYVLKNATNDVNAREECTETVKPYYHLLTLFNEHITNETNASEARLTLIKWIEETNRLDLGKDVDKEKYNKLVELTFTLAKLTDTKEVDFKLSHAITDWQLEKRHPST